MFQSTIAREASAEGVGLHTGVHGHVRLLPAPADTGIVFRRTDLENFPIEAQGHNVLFFENTDGGHAAAADHRQAAEMWALSFVYLKQQLHGG